MDTHQVAAFESPKQQNKDVEANSGKLNLVTLSENQPPKCTLDTYVTQLAKVGPYVQKQTDVEEYCTGMAHPGNSHAYETTNSKTGKHVELTDIFKNEDIYSALMKDKVVQKALNEENIHPKNFEELKEAFHNGVRTPEDAKGRMIDGVLNDDVFSNFAFHHVTGDKIATRILLDPVSEAGRNEMNQLGILLPIPDELKSAFRAADTGKRGFLMEDYVARGKRTFDHKEFYDNE